MQRRQCSQRVANRLMLFVVRLQRFLTNQAEEPLRRDNRRCLLAHCAELGPHGL